MLITKDGKKYILVPASSQLVKSLAAERRRLVKSGVFEESPGYDQLLVAAWELYRRMVEDVDGQIERLNKGWELWAEYLHS